MQKENICGPIARGVSVYFLSVFQGGGLYCGVCLPIICFGRTTRHILEDGHAGGIVAAQFSITVTQNLW